METVENKRFVYEFGKFVLDPQEKTLFVDGKAVHLPAKEFETLLLLVENNGKALTKEEMIEAIWQDAFVEETNLAKQISRLRKVFNSSGEKLIETLPKHGYRFSAEVNQIFQPAGETILEKRTVKRLIVRVENEFDDAPLALPPKRNGFWGAGLLAALVLIAAAVAGFVLFWQRQKPIVKPDASGIVFLTDGSHDDTGARLTNQGQIYFSRYITNTRVESWQMNADGTNQRRANTEIKNLLHGVWSPDGNKVVFLKEGDDKTFYLADASGANEIALPFVVGNMDWSPDGSRFVYQGVKDGQGNSQIHAYTLKTGESVKLTDTAGNADPSFSYDGKQIAFTSWRDGNAEIYVMNADGSNVRRVTNHPAFDQFPVFTPDGTAIAFQSNRENERIEVYLQNLNADTPPKRITNSDNGTMLCVKGWSADGTEMLFVASQNGKNRIFRANVVPYPSRVILSDETADLSFPRLSPDGEQILYQAQFKDGSIELRLTDLETRATKTIFKTAPNYPKNYPISPAWSPDSGRIAFNDKPAGNSEIFTINADGSGLQNLTNEPLSDSNPVFSPDGSEIIFARDFYGKARLYRMNLDGTNQRRLTEKDGYEMNGTFSPDGSLFAFAADRVDADSRGLDIFLLGFKNPNEEKRLTNRRFHDVAPAFSPDGKRIAFASNADGNFEIYLMNADGTGLFRLTRSNAEETAPQFSRDGKSLIFASNRNGKFALYEIELP
jgi:Tol biopolymer transport system component/DNA-binding winged helix-turn-helix (wHTH) protein